MLLSSFAFNFNLRRYNVDFFRRNLFGRCQTITSRQGLTLVHFSAQPEPFLTPNTPLNTPECPSNTS